MAVMLPAMGATSAPDSLRRHGHRVLFSGPWSCAEQAAECAKSFIMQAERIRERAAELKNQGDICWDACGGWDHLQNGAECDYCGSKGLCCSPKWDVTCAVTEQTAGYFAGDA